MELINFKNRNVLILPLTGNLSAIVIVKDPAILPTDRPVDSTHLKPLNGILC